MSARQNISNTFIRLSIITQLLFLPICQPAQADEEETHKNSIQYPATPEGVVAAYVREDSNGSALHSKTWGKIQQYTSWVDSPGWDEATVIFDFKIRKIKEGINTADVEVSYEIIGDLSPTAYFKFEFNPERLIETIIFKLTKHGMFWKIDSPQEQPHVSREVAIEILENELSNEKDSINLKRKRQIINFLKSLYK